MNDKILQELQSQVDRAIHPLIASPRRLRTMREELLSHMVETFNEEFARTQDEPSARDATLRRFGNTTEVSARLQSSIPPFERALAFIFSGKETPMTRALWIIVVAAFLIRPFLPLPISEHVLFAAIALTTILCSRHLLHEENIAPRTIGRRGTWLVGVLAFFFGIGIVLPGLARFKQTVLAQSTKPLPAFVTAICVEAIAVGTLITLLGLFFFIRNFFRPRVQTS